MNEKTSEVSDDDLRAFFATRPDVRLAYLFGSRARGDAAETSDPDFGVLLQEDTDHDYRFILTHELVILLGTSNLDVVPLRTAPSELAYNSSAEGRLVFERELEERVDFEARIISKYCDYLPILRQQREDIIRETLR
jgi:predicted nucleotidyltransferase